LLQAHEQFVQLQIQDLQKNLEVIRWKIGYYKTLEANPDKPYDRQNDGTAEQAFFAAQGKKINE